MLKLTREKRSKIRETGAVREEGKHVTREQQSSGSDDWGGINTCSGAMWNQEEGANNSWAAVGGGR